MFDISYDTLLITILVGILAIYTIITLDNNKEKEKFNKTMLKYNVQDAWGVVDLFEKKIAELDDILEFNKNLYYENLSKVNSRLESLSDA